MSTAPYSALTMLAYQLDALEAARKAIENQHRAFTNPPKNAFDTAKNLAGTPAATLFESMLKGIAVQEKDTIKKLEAATFAHPMAGAFVDARLGIGLKGIGRLLGTIGDPLWNGSEDRLRRGPAELWAYCGYHTIPAGGQFASDSHLPNVPGGNVRPRRQRGVKCNWSPRAKTAAFVVAESAYRQGYYRPVYVAEKDKAATKVHCADCRNRVRPPGRPNGCGTVAHPEWGEPGSPWRPGHQHQHALSMVAKTILKDLFVEAQSLAA